MIDELLGWGLRPPPVSATPPMARSPSFALGLEDREIDYVLDVKAATSALPERVDPSGRRGRAAAARRRALPRRSAALRELALAAGEQARVRSLARGHARSDDLALSRAARPARQRRAAQRSEPRHRAARPLAAGRMAPRRSRADRLLALQPARRDPAARARRAAKLRWRIEQDYRELKDALGLDHFEGRSWRGWHHHVTLVSVAHGFLTSNGPPPATGRQPDLLFELVRELQAPSPAGRAPAQPADDGCRPHPSAHHPDLTEQY